MPEPRRFLASVFGGLIISAIALLAGCATTTVPLSSEPDGLRLQAGPDVGLVVRSGAGDSRATEILRVSGEGVIDAIDYDSRNSRNDRVRLDRALLRVDGRVHEDIHWRVTGDLKGIDTRFGFAEGWASWSQWKSLRLTGGLIPIPLGIEDSLRRADYSFVAHSFPSYLSGRTDFGLSVDGEIEEGLLYYQVSAAAGEGFDSFGQRRGDPQLAGRLMTYPLRRFDSRVQLLDYEIPLLSGLFFSTSYAWTPHFEGHIDVATELRNQLFLTPRLDARGGSRLYFLGYGVDAGPFRFIHEWVNGSLFELRTPTAGRRDLENQITGMAVSLAWMVTGEPYDTRTFAQRDGRPRTFPSRPLLAHSPTQSPGYGALELAARYANGDIDRDFFNLGLTDFTVSSQEFRTFTFAINWFPIWNVRVSTEVVRVIADQFPGVFDSHGRDTSFILRLQLQF